MGSTGSWDASLSLKKKISLSQKEKNSKEEIEEFLKGNAIGKEIDYQNVKESDLIVAVIGYNYDDEEIRVDLKDIKKDAMTLKEFEESGIFDSEEDFYSDECELEDRRFIVKVDNIYTILENVNLDILSKNLSHWNLNNPKVTYSEENLASCSEYIYCDNDNSDESIIKVTKKFIEKLSPGDELVLKGNGDGEHC